MNRKQFRQLKNKWYGKLKASGFKDIERDEFNLKKPTAKWILPRKGLVRSGRYKAIQEYYYYGEHFLSTYNFNTPFDKIIWAYHINGMSMKGIADTLNKTKIYRTNHTTVWQVIKRLREIMKNTLIFNNIDEGPKQ